MKKLIALSVAGLLGLGFSSGVKAFDAMAGLAAANAYTELKPSFEKGMEALKAVKVNLKPKVDAVKGAVTDAEKVATSSAALDLLVGPFISFGKLFDSMSAGLLANLAKAAGQMELSEKVSNLSKDFVSLTKAFEVITKSIRPAEKEAPAPVEEW